MWERMEGCDGGRGGGGVQGQLSRKEGDGEDEKKRYEKVGEKEWKEAISVEVGGKTRFRHRGKSCTAPGQCSQARGLVRQG